jgi:iron complex transport system ATP-binding protein
MEKLELCNTELGYRRHTVVNSLDVEVNAGEIVGIIGPNGSGKSTILKAMCGLLQPYSGQARLEGIELSKISRSELAQKVGMVPQAPSLPHTFTLMEMVLMGRYPHLGLLRYESKRDIEIVCNAMERTGVISLSERRMGEVSGGEKQRAIIARALAQEPRFLLLDEPTAHLDIQHQLEIMELVRSLADSGLGVVVALHDFSLAGRYCHRLVLLKDGSIFREGPPQAVLTTDNIKQVFGVVAMIYDDLSPGPIVVNAALSRPASNDGQRHIHLIGGGGSATGIMQELHMAGYYLTAGVLHHGDTDLSTARALGIETIVVPPFAEIDDESHRLNLQLVSQCDCCVVTNSAFGRGNVRNLEAAASTRQLMIVDETPISNRDFTGGQATEVYNGLKRHAYVCSGSVLECLKENIFTLTDSESGLAGEANGPQFDNVIQKEV